MNAGLRRLWLLLCLLLLAPAAEAATISARVRWQPSASAAVVGYRVYSRLLSGAYGAPLDAGKPAPATDGSLSYVVAGIDDAVDYAFKVSAYQADGSESAPSNEVILRASGTTTTTTTSSTTTTTTRPTTTTTTTSTTRPTTTTTSTTTTTTTLPPPITTTTVPTTTSSTATSTTETTTTTSTTTLPGACRSTADCSPPDACTQERCVGGECVGVPLVCADPGPCAQATCDPDLGCVVEAFTDGDACNGGDPCLPGTCQAGACVPPAGSSSRSTGGHYLAVSRFVMRAVGRTQRMVAAGSFGTVTPVDPTVTGGVLEVSAPDGAVLYHAVVPPSAFRANRTRRAFKYVRPRSAPPVTGVNGLTRLVLHVDGNGADVLATGASPDLSRAAARPTIRWAVHFGGECVRDLGLICSTDASGITRCD